MRGELLPIWPHMKDLVWDKLEKKATAHPDLYCELFRTLNDSLVAPLSIDPLAEVVGDPKVAKAKFRKISASEIAGESGLLAFLEAAHDTLLDLGGDALANMYFQLLDEFLITFSVRYDLRRPCTLCPTLSGLFCGVVAQLRTQALGDAHVLSLLKDFEAAIQDIQSDSSDTKIKTCIQKQMNLMEGLGQKCPTVTGNTLGAICEQVGTWPHEKVKDALKNLYAFACDYPGIRHGGTSASALRQMEMRDFVALTIASAGLSTYITDGFNAPSVYNLP